MLTLIKNFKYDNSYNYVKTFSTKEEQNIYFNSLPNITIEETEYIKDHKSINVKYNYDDLVFEGVNYLIIDNGVKDVYAFITRKEYVNDKVTKLYFEIDVIQTFLFDFSINKSFIERKKCSINEVLEYDEGLEMGEHVIISNTISLTKNDEYFALFSGFKDYYLEETDNANKYVYKEYPYADVDKPITNIDGVPYPLLFLPLSDDGNMTFFKKSFCNLPNLVGIIRLTNVTYTKKEMFVPFLKVTDNKIARTGSVGLFAQDITSTEKEGSSISIPKNDIFDFFPYTYYIITDNESEPLVLHPQYLSDTLSVKGVAIPSHTPIERYYPNNYKNSTDGKLYYIENNSISMLPVGTNGGIESITNSYATLKQEQNSTFLNAVTGVADGIVSLTTGNIGGGISQIANGVNNVFNKIARQRDLALTPNTVKSLGNANTRNKLNTKTVNIIKYSIQEKYKDRIRNYIERYGNKYNNYGVIDIKSYKGYIKYNEPNIDSSIDNEFISIIKLILERGVYIE